MFTKAVIAFKDVVHHDNPNLIRADKDCIVSAGKQVSPAADLIR